MGQRYRIDYDEEADILYVSFGKPKKAVGIEMGNGNVVRVDPFNASVTGITIIDFNYRYGGLFEHNIEETTRTIVPEILNEFKNYRKSHGSVISTKK